MGDEGGEFRRVVLQVFAHGIVEGKEIGFLGLDGRQMKEDGELFQQFGQRHQAEDFRLADEVFRQVVVQVAQQEGVQVDVPTEHFVLIADGQLRLGNPVFGVCQVSEGIHHQADGKRGIQSESFVRHDSVRGVLVEVGGDDRYLAILPHQDGHVVHLDTLSGHAFHFSGQLFECVFLIVLVFLGGDEGQLDGTLHFFPADFLLHILISMLQFLAIRALFLAMLVVQDGTCRGENFVVEAHDVGLAPPVSGQGLFADGEGADVVLQSVQDGPVAASPTVDALLHVAHDEAIRPLREPFEEEELEVVPLHP